MVGGAGYTEQKTQIKEWFTGRTNEFFNYQYNIISRNLVWKISKFSAHVIKSVKISHDIKDEIPNNITIVYYIYPMFQN